MSEPIGTRVNLRDVFNPERLKEFKKGQLLHFSDGTEHTWVKVIRAGNIRYEGEVVNAPMTQDEINEQNDREMKEQLAKEGYSIPPTDITDQVEVIKKKRAPHKKKED